MSPCEEAAFLGGVLVSLQIVDAAGEDTLYMEIAQAAGLRQLWEVAESMDREHLRRQLRRSGKRLPRKRGRPGKSVDLVTQ